MWACVHTFGQVQQSVCLCKPHLINYGIRCRPAAAMPTEGAACEGGARLGCCMLTRGALLDGRISVVGPVSQSRQPLIHTTPFEQDAIPCYMPAQQG